MISLKLGLHCLNFRCTAGAVLPHHIIATCVSHIKLKTRNSIMKKRICKVLMLTKIISVLQEEQNGLEVSRKEL